LDRSVVGVFRWLYCVCVCVCVCVYLLSHWCLQGRENAEMRLGVINTPMCGRVCANVCV